MGRKTTIESAMARAVRDEETGCLIYPVSKEKKVDGTYMQPMATISGLRRSMKRVAWELAGRPLNPEDRLETTCGRATCIEPDHQAVQTPKEVEDKKREVKSMARKPSSVKMREAILFFVSAREDGLREPVLDLLVEGRKNNPGRGLVGGVEPTYREGRPPTRKPESYLKKKRRDMENAIAALEREGAVEVTEELRVRLRNGGRRK